MDTPSFASDRRAQYTLPRALARVAAFLGLLSALACSGSDGGGSGGNNNTGGTTSDGAVPVNDGAGGTADHAAPDSSLDAPPDVATGTGGSAGGSTGDAEAGPGGGGSSGNDGASGDARPDTGGGGDATADRVFPPDGMGDSGGGPGDAGPDAPPDVIPDRAPPHDVFDAPPDIPSVVDVVPHVDAGTGGYLTVVAHPDDDIIFMNPDLETFNRSGLTSCTVYVTSGDRDETVRGWMARERGILDAQAAMAGQTTQCLLNPSDTNLCRWQCGNATYSGHPVVRCDLATAPISAIFLRLPDMSIGRLWGPPADPDPTMHLTQVSQIADSGTTATYTTQDLIDVLTAIMNDFVPSTILTMDSTMAYNSNAPQQGSLIGTFDHPDHMGSGFFALAAAQVYHRYDSVRIYRGYTTLGVPPNLSQAQINEKESIFEIYGADHNGAPTCADYDECQRQVLYASIVRTGVIRQGSLCLQTAGANVELATCDGTVTEQMWTGTTDARIMSSGGQCLTAGGALSVAACNASAASQRWTWFEPANGQLRGVNGGCVAQGDNMAVGVVTCSAVNIDTNTSAGVDPTQAWVTP